MSFLTILPGTDIDTSDADGTHKHVMGLFDEQLPGEAHERRMGVNILWRPERGGRVLVRSDIAPAILPDGARTVEEAEPAREGQRVMFQVTFDATRRGREGTRLVAEEDVPALLLEKVGHALGDIDVMSVTRSRSRRHGAPLWHTTVTGVALVIDEDEFARFTRRGVGRSRAYGCGLLTALPLAG